MEQMGGKNSMSVGMGKSNARVYGQSSDGIRFSDGAGEDEAKENLAEIVDYLHNPKKYTDVGASMPKGVSGGPSGHRQDHAGQGRRRRGGGALLLHVGL